MLLAFNPGRRTVADMPSSKQSIPDAGSSLGNRGQSNCCRFLSPLAYAHAAWRPVAVLGQVEHDPGGGAFPFGAPVSDLAGLATLTPRFDLCLYSEVVWQHVARDARSSSGWAIHA